MWTEKLLEKKKRFRISDRYKTECMSTYMYGMPDRRVKTINRDGVDGMNSFKYLAASFLAKNKGFISHRSKCDWTNGKGSFYLDKRGFQWELKKKNLQYHNEILC